MKKAIFVCALGVFAIASCKKDYTCDCTNTVDGMSAGTTSITINDTKRKAKEECEATGGSVSFGSYTSTTECGIKE